MIHTSTGNLHQFREAAHILEAVLEQRPESKVRRILLQSSEDARSKAKLIPAADLAPRDR